MKVLLTSAGFENGKIADLFIRLIGKKPQDSRIVFIPTAAITAESINMLPKCMNDLLSIGVNANNILVYDLHYKMKRRVLSQYDAVYVCGGNTDYLIQRINRSGFRKALLRYIDDDGVYVGVSAGSCVMANNVKNGLGLFNGSIGVHRDKGESAGRLSRNCGDVDLTNSQALFLGTGEMTIIE